MDETTGSDETRKIRHAIEISQDNTEDIPYSPQVDTGFGNRDIAIGEQILEIHDTHNFPNVFAVYIQPVVSRPATQTELETLSIAYGPRIKSGGFDLVFERLAQEYPRLYAKITSYIHQAFAEADAKHDVGEVSGKNSPQYVQEVEHWKKSLDEVNLREYFFSKAFDAMSLIGSEIDLDSPLSQLCED